VPEGKTVKNRVHLDVTTDIGIAAEVERLVAAGASVVAEHRSPDHYSHQYRWTVLEDIEGNEFCVIEPL
jgi:predicted enzyme related to lactoylglutathione lyase